MNWTQVSPTRWERPLSGMEEYFVFIGNITAALYDGRQQYTVLSKVKVTLNIPDVESTLRHAWKQVRYEEPDIATTVEPGKKIFEVLDDTSIEKWVDETFIVDTERDAEELYRLGRTMKPATMYYLPKSSELVIHAHHAVFDGIGMIMVWDRFFRAVTNPKDDITFGGEHVRLAPALDDLVGLKGPPTPEQSEKGLAILMEYITKLPAVGLPSKVGKVPAGQCQAIEYVFSEETTSAIIRACKARGITVTSGVHAAYISVLARYADPASNTTRYASPNEFNLRGRLEAPYSQVAAANYYLPLPFSVDLPATFDELSTVLNKYYRGYLNENPEVLEVQASFTQALQQIVKTPEYQSAPIPTDALVSSLGIIENHLQHSYGEGDAVVVEDWKLACDNILGMTGFHFYTFRGKLRFVYQFNEAYQEPKDIRMYMEEIERVLREELVFSKSGKGSPCGLT
ncbi:hypothetical protein BJX68DRAFT_260686 [Aspergillus pseudodeflectus]|uniref:Condensation domain-containing protein n=1 Tax=Aspergillus pseudodeflectus TaxID=176178 RepID=A0ABR4LBH7_9EURO